MKVHELLNYIHGKLETGELTLDSPILGDEIDHRYSPIFFISAKVTKEGRRNYTYDSEGSITALIQEM